MRLAEMIYTEEEYKELADELEYVRIIKDSAEKTLKEVREENNKLKLHIEAKDKAYTALLKDYEELKEKNKKLREEIGEWLNVVRKSLEK